jgi:hypothetical protein
MKFGEYKWTKKALFVAGICITLSLVAMAGYDLLCFMPYRSDMKQLLSEADPENRHPPQIVSNLIDVSNQNGATVAASVAHKLLTRYTKASQHRMIIWHINYLLWNWLVYLHLSKEELYAYYCLLSFNGQDYGANELSNRLFDKPLSQLNEQEAATVVATLVFPSHSLHSKETIKKYQNDLLTKLAASGRGH